MQIIFVFLPHNIKHAEMGHHHLSRRATYTLPALQKYLTHISLPPCHQNTLLQNLHTHDQVTGSRPSKWGTSSEALQALEVLQKYQQVKIPFTNLYMHYSPFHTGTLEPEGLYRYMIESESMVSSSTSFHHRHAMTKSGEEDILTYSSKPPGDTEKTERERQWDGREPSGGRGGTCTLNNGFFGTVMRSLGMQVKTTGARVAMSYNGGPEGPSLVGII